MKLLILEIGDGKEKEGRGVGGGGGDVDVQRQRNVYNLQLAVQEVDHGSEAEERNIRDIKETSRRLREMQ